MDYKEIIKKFGNVVFDAKSIVEEDRMIIPVSPCLDAALGGGILEGSYVVFSGQMKTGKTSLALSVAATCQKPEYGDRHIYYCNVEARLKKRDLLGIAGLNLDKFHVFGSSKGNILNAAQFLELCEQIIHDHPGCVLIIDSFSALSTEAEMTGGMSDMQRADGSKLVSKFCRKTGPIVPINKNIVIGITHLISNPSGYGKSFIEKTSQALAYQVDTKLLSSSIQRVFNADKPIGQNINWEVITSGLGPPGSKATSFLRYGYGIDKPLELVRIGVDFGFVKKAGSWFEFENGQKCQGEENARQYLIENPDLYDDIYKKFREFFIK